MRLGFVYQTVVQAPESVINESFVIKKSRIEGQVSTINKKDKGARIKGKGVKEQGKRLEANN